MADDFYQSREWLELRYRALCASQGKCQCCGARGRLHVDHIKPRSKYPNLQLSLSNLQILCDECNLGKSNIDETDWRDGEYRLNLCLDTVFDALENVRAQFVRLRAWDSVEVAKRVAAEEVKRKLRIVGSDE